VGQLGPLGPLVPFGPEWGRQPVNSFITFSCPPGGRYLSIILSRFLLRKKPAQAVNNYHDSQLTRNISSLCMYGEHIIGLLDVCIKLLQLGLFTT